MFYDEEQDDIQDDIQDDVQDDIEDDIENEEEDINTIKSKKKQQNKLKYDDNLTSSHLEIMDFIDEFNIIEKQKKDTSNLPWIEEFRPKKLKNINDHEHIISILKNLIKKKKFPNLILSGPPGTGKTSTIMACARKLYKDNIYMMVLDINASEERGIDVVRNKIKNFIMTKGIHNCEPSFKLVILDEADAMTKEAQNMLVNIMENYIHNARFCLICNYIKKMNPALLSRCSIMKFLPLKREKMVDKINEISRKYNFDVSNDGINTLIKISNGDMRKVINIVQATHMAFKNVNENNICKCIGYPLEEDIKNIFEMLLKNDIKYCYENIEKIMKKNGYSLVDLIKELFNKYIKLYMEGNFPNNLNIEKLIINLQNIEANLIMCQNENLQLSGFIASCKS